MKRKIILYATCTICVVLCWLLQYSKINKYYEEISNLSVEEYRKGEKVPFETDFIEYGINANGYTICVDKFEITDYTDYIRRSSIETSGKLIKPEKIALVYITLTNVNCASEGIPLTEFSLHGLDSCIPMSWNLLSEMNPVLQGSNGIRLNEGDSYALILPFNLYKRYFKTLVWKNIEDYDFFLRVTAYPTAKDILVN